MFPYITFTLLIFFIVIFLLYTYKIGYDNKDNFKNLFNKNKNAIKKDEINYLKYNTDLTKIAINPSGNPLDYKPLKENYNYTKLYYIFLIELFKALSVNKEDYKIKLIDKFPKSIINSNITNTLDMLVKPILGRIKQIAPMTDFWLVGYDNYDLYEIKNSNLKLHKINCFLYMMSMVLFKYVFYLKLLKNQKI